MRTWLADVRSDTTAIRYFYIIDDSGIAGVAIVPGIVTRVSVGFRGRMALSR